MAPVAWMGDAPGLHPPDIFRIAEVVTIVGLGQPSTLAAGLAGPATECLRAEALVSEIAWVGAE